MTVTRSDISPGYQVVQTAHAIADFAHEHPETFRRWKSESNSIITLSINDEKRLVDLYEKLLAKGTRATMFREPDIGNEATSFCVYGTPDIRKQLSSLPLTLKKVEK